MVGSSREIWCSNRETGRFHEKLGDSRESRESWQVCKLCRFLSRKLNEVQCQFYINSRCIYCYCFVYILYRLLNKQLRQLPRKRSLSENRSYHISINKQRFMNRTTVVHLRCIILLGTMIIRISLEMKFYS